MRIIKLMLAAVVLITPVPVGAQSTDDIVEVDTGEAQEEDGSSRLGLLGLLGLAGLLGLRRREPDIHVDARQQPGD